MDRDKERDTERETERETQRVRQRQRQTDRQTDRDRDIQTDLLWRGHLVLTADDVFLKGHGGVPDILQAGQHVTVRFKESCRLRHREGRLWRKGGNLNRRRDGLEGFD